MKAVIETVKKIYEKNNIKKHIILFIIVTFFTTLSTLYDIRTGQPETWKQNYFDWILNILIAIYSIQFLHDCFRTPETTTLPSWNKIELKAIPGQIILSIIWTLYLFIIGILALIWYAATDDLILPIFIAILLIGFMPSIYYSYIKFSENFSLKKTFDIIALVKYTQKVFKPTMKVYIQYIFAFIILFVLYICLYFIGGLAGITTLFPIENEYFAFDFITSAFFEYILNLLLFFMFPYSLFKIYICTSEDYGKDSKLLLAKEEENKTDTNN